PLIGVFAHRQRGQPLEEIEPVGEIDLDFGGHLLGMVESADGELQPEFGLVGERGAAIGAEGPAGGVRGLEPFWLVARPASVMGGDKRAEEAAERLLAHAAVADRAASNELG